MFDQKGIVKELKKINGLKVLQKEPLSRHTSLKVGGPADILVIPKDINALQEAIRATRGLDKYVIGNGSNLLLPDKGLKGIVLKIAGGMNGFSVDGRTVSVGAGTLMQSFLNKLAGLGLSGLEFASWVPAALGGAVFMNMGAFGEDISKYIEYVEVIYDSGKIDKLSKNDIKFSYRKSGIKGCIVTSVNLRLNYKQKDLIKKRMREIISKRKEMQPVNVPSAGSVFKNPKDVPAGKLIDMAGLKGERIGGAEISRKHANFIINLGDAREADIRSLINRVRKCVKEKFRLKLDLELIDSSRLNMLF